MKATATTYTGGGTTERLCLGVKEGVEYAFLTDIITKEWSGMTTKQYKQHKSLKKESS